MPLYAAYGTNMAPAQMLRHAPHSPLAGTAWLEGWRLTFAGEDMSCWEGALATVVEDPDSRVFVALYDVPAHDEKQLDEWEAYDQDLHRKIKARVTARITTPPRPGTTDTEPDIQIQEKSVLVWFYVMDAYEGGLPSAQYLAMVADAAEEAGAPANYVHDLRMRSCRPAER